MIQQVLGAEPEPATIFVGFSGGMDSTVLLHFLWRWREQNTAVNLKAIHVNHKLQSQSDAWQRHCQQVCEQWGIPFIVEQVQVDRNQSSLEQVARNARYQVFRRHVGSDGILMLAHHRDDQIETLLQRLARGSGPLGLGAMLADSRRFGVRILRPLLDQDRDTLLAYAESHQLVWVDDPSNQSEVHERNYIRRQLLPTWRKFKPGLNQTIARSARLNQEASNLLDQLAALDLGRPRTDGGLDIALLNDLDLPRQKNLLRFWIHCLGGRAPAEAVLVRVLSEVIPATEDANPRVAWGQTCIRRFQQVLYLTPVDLDARQSVLSVPVAGLEALHGVTSSLGCLQVEFPISPALLNTATGFSLQRLQAGKLYLGLRCGGERVKPHGQPTKSLKNWFQSLAVPPWLRWHWPILYCDGEIAGLPGLLVCEGFEAQGEQDRVAIDWHWQISLPGLD